MRRHCGGQRPTVVGDGAPRRVRQSTPDTCLLPLQFPPFLTFLVPPLTRPGQRRT